MKQEERDCILFKIENEGIDDTFNSYSDFYDIDDMVFHRLRLNYIHARKQLEEYIKLGKLTRETLADKT
jgi:hypothetical protein